MVKKVLKDRPELEVSREYGMIIKLAKNDSGKAEIAREAKILQALPEGIGPAVLRSESDRLVLEDLGNGDPVKDEYTFLRNAIHALNGMRGVGVRHGDLTAANIIVHNDKPRIIDWSESRFVAEKRKDKRPEPDAYHYWTAIAALSPDTSRIVRRWLAIREHLSPGSALVNLGCFTGEMDAMAAAEGCITLGIDKVQHVIDLAKEMWGQYGCQFRIGDLDAIPVPIDVDNVLLLSVFPYIQNPGGMMKKLVKSGATLFFETQLAGDGPGPDIFRTDADVKQYLSKFYGRVESLVTLAIAGRNAKRTTWKCTLPLG